MAIVLDAMVKDPRGWHSPSVIVEATGARPVTTRQNMARLFSHGWAYKKPGDRIGTPAPRMYYKLTRAGLERARASLAEWSIAQGG